MFRVDHHRLFCTEQEDDTPKAAQSIAELQQQLEKILTDTRTPGLSVAIVHRDPPPTDAGGVQALPLRNAALEALPREKPFVMPEQWRPVQRFVDRQIGFNPLTQEATHSRSPIVQLSP